jgi:hypothetical protein
MTVTHLIIGLIRKFENQESFLFFTIELLIFVQIFEFYLVTQSL